MNYKADYLDQRVEALLPEHLQEEGVVFRPADIGVELRGQRCQQLIQTWERDGGERTHACILHTVTDKLRHKTRIGTDKTPGQTPEMNVKHCSGIILYVSLALKLLPYEMENTHATQGSNKPCPITACTSWFCHVFGHASS